MPTSRLAMSEALGKAEDQKPETNMKGWEEKATLRGGRTWEPSQEKFSKMPV